jgi:hypothetical protein
MRTVALWRRRSQ